MGGHGKGRKVSSADEPFWDQFRSKGGEDVGRGGVD